MMRNGPTRPVDPDEVARQRDIFAGMVAATASFTDGMTAVLADLQERFVLVPRDEYEATRTAYQHMLAAYYEEGHPGYPCLRTGWIRTTVVDDWRSRLPRYVP